VSIADIRAGLAAALDTIPGLRTSAYYPDTMTPPIGIVDTYRVNFDLAAARGSDDFTFDILIVVRRQSERQAQADLDEFVPLVKAAIEADKSLGGAADSLHCQAMSGYSPLGADENTYLAASFAVRVIATA
jgi:hypothetical protein